MEVKPHQGYGALVLGRTQATLIGQLGNPEERVTEYYPDQSRVEYFEYQDLGLSVAFDPCQGDRIINISVRSRDALLDGQPIIGIPVSCLLQRFPNLLRQDNGFHYSDESSDLLFCIEGGTVLSVTVFPAYSKDDEPIWPSASLASEQNGCR